jgi:isopenicillin-N epimerase
MERRPTRFMNDELPTALRAAAGRLAAFVGAEARDLAFVENATAGCNAVLASLPLGAGDEILLTDHGYAAVRNAAAHIARRTGARVVEAPIRFPLHDPAGIADAVGSRLGPRTRLVILDHITSPTAVILPIAELCAMCRAAGARVLVDGAHAPGMLALDIPAIGADWYVGNCHKWLMAPKGAGFLWANPSAQADLHPLVISHGYGRGFCAEFDWIGTRDPTAWLAVADAIDFHELLGGQELRRRNAALAREAAAMLAAEWRTERGTSDALTGSMASVRLPVHEPASTERAAALRIRLFEEHRIEVAVAAFAGALWARVSAQAYNEPADYARLARVFAA